MPTAVFIFPKARKRALPLSEPFAYRFEVIRRKVRIVVSRMLNDNQCFRIIGFMVAVITTFATTCLAIIASVN